ncbi:fibronectin type III domain-containing protein [Streptomyces sp. FH025]|uniref:fibronectin type III domain-containing protein n=1 Tax=Streptomyces sp. FH025 TaxID=2815937 RepID=UPI001A9DD136|nr:fibronectin type III domain-containing protein [Streptomyces sp. FH025]MBO1413653.1 fibronectin type III domain-containing protein [Streptomyces sp. FH025]
MIDKVVAKPKWQPGGSKYYAKFDIRFINFSSKDVVDPTIEFTIPPGLTFADVYGLTGVSQKGQVITAHLVPEKKTIKANRGTEVVTCSFASGAGVEGLGTDPKLLPSRFKVNGVDADVPPDPAKPSVPQGLKVVRVGPKSVTLTWQPSDGQATVYGYEVSVSGRKEPVDTDTNTATVRGLKPDTPYTFKVRAYSLSDVRSDWSAEVPGTTGRALPDQGVWRVPRSPFVDFTADPPKPDLSTYAEASKNGAATWCDGFVLGFVVVTPTGDPVPRWGGVTEDPRTSGFGKDQIKSFREKYEGKVVISFGGQANLPIEARVTDVDSIVDIYRKIIANYEVKNLDFDFEAGFLKDDAALGRHLDAAIALLGQVPGLQLSYTLPVDAQPTVQGFSPEGEAFVKELAAAGIEPSLINGMLMSFSAGSPPDALEACKVGLNGMHKQISNAGFGWDAKKVWSRIGACPMYGKQDVPTVEMTVEAMRGLLKFATDTDLGAITGWSANRDYNETTLASCKTKPELFQCTETKQGASDFTKIVGGYKRT